MSERKDKKMKRRMWLRGKRNEEEIERKERRKEKKNAL